MPGKIVQRRPAYIELANYVSRMEKRNLLYINLLSYIHFLTMQNEEIKAIILNEVENNVTRITYEVITIVQCLHQQRNANGFA